MKRFDVFKTIQLIIFIAVTAFCVIMVISDEDLYHLIANNGHIKLICAMLWGSLGLTFLFIFFDFSLFSSFKSDYRELDYAVHSDPVAGIANRYSCDVLIEKYLDQPLPENLGCIMFDLSNIAEINRLYGHIKGNTLIHDFSNILKLTSVDLCFVGRNGGNKFLAVFEDSSIEDIETFLMRVDQKVKAHNASSENFPIEYRYGTAFHESSSIKTITELIALSNKRIGTYSTPEAKEGE